MSDAPLPSPAPEAPLPAPRRSRMRTVVFGAVVLVSGMVIGSGLTVIGIRQRVAEFRQKPELFSNRILARMEKDLELTKDQKSELGKIFGEAREELEEVRGQHRAQGQAFFRDFHDQVSRVLTPDQQKEWETWWKRARERAFQERSGGPPRAGGAERARGPRPEKEFVPLRTPASPQ